MKPIWIVDDDHSIRFVLEKALAREALPTRSFTNSRDVLAALKDIHANGSGTAAPPQVLISDIRMSGGSGLDLLAHVKRQHPHVPVIIMTAFSDLDSAVSAFQGGAFEYLAKPFDVPRAVELIRRALEESRREDVAEIDADAAPEMLGQAPAMQDVFRAIGRLSQSSVTVLITGESGTGKELVARALHKHSPRAGGPFVAINTAAIPRDLLESELFGHERGAFTGAQTMRRGRFEQAEGGTLFLDEIGDMPFELQTRLLRVLSDGHFYRVGGHNAIKAQVRVIAATHQHLEQQVREGVFREDLFHRLNVIRLRVPALRERREDIPLLMRFFLQESARQLGMEAKRISASALDKVMRFDFPGNVRQLENICHWLTVMAPAQAVGEKDLPQELCDGAIAPTHARDSATTRHDGTRIPPPQMVQAAAATAAQAPADEESHHARKQVRGGVHAGSADEMSGARIDDAKTHGLGPVTAVAESPADMVPPRAWDVQLGEEALALLGASTPDVWDVLVRRVESALIRAALKHTCGKRMEAAQKLGIGRNTLTRKIQELGLAAAGDGAD